ncbi:hypothetical protein HAX54_027542 [Datura stramonium]|uniref:FAD-binding PCMH-type domain-containing protein n=1 Tax=Datura stramonium TaxID=4076 RepID=A0ABS8V461_DATST|nr:hypothetical protein [Datura stramonium]
MVLRTVQPIPSTSKVRKVPIVPYGGATSIEGHTLSPNGGVCIDMTLMNSAVSSMMVQYQLNMMAFLAIARVKALHVEDMDVVVEPGIGWMELNEYLEPCGLFFPLDPGPGATIGGMCATRCSGSLAVSQRLRDRDIVNLTQLRDSRMPLAVALLAT